jgi:hypothetical protein
MASHEKLWRRGAFAHYLSMLALLVLLAGCATGDLTESSEPQVPALGSAAVSGDLPVLKGNRGRKNKNQDPGDLTAIVISPSSVSMKPGESQRFTATAKLRDGTTTAANVSWTANGGTIDRNGLYTNGSSGKYRVLATSLYDNLADTATVTVSTTAPATLVSISVRPGSATLATGATQRFAVSGTLSDGTTNTPAVTWTVTGGSITEDGLYTAGSQAGTYRAVATSGNDLADTATVTVTAPASEPPPPPPPTGSLPFAPAPPPATRVVNVSTQSQLLAAVSNSQPGDHIVLASGTYVGGVQMACGDGGTAQRPLVITGPRSAVIDVNGGGYGFRVRGPYVQIRGVTIRDAQFGVFVEQCAGSAEPTDVVLDGLDIGPVRQNGIVLRNAHRAYVQRGKIHDVSGANWTEGIYIGHSSDPGQMSDNVRVLGMAMGPGIRQEHIDVKGLSARRSTGCLIQGNTFDATGTQFVEYPASNGVISDQGASGCQYVDNTIVNINSTGLSGFFFYTAVRPTAQGNVVAAGANRISGAYGYRVASPVTDPKIYCDNEGTRNVSCTQ